MTDMLSDVDRDEIDLKQLGEKLKNLRALRANFDTATDSLERRREAGRQRIAELQAEIDAEIDELAELANDAATAFNQAASDLVETGFASPKLLASRGLGVIKVSRKGRS